MRTRFEPTADMQPRYMKKLPFPTNKIASEAMRKQQAAALETCDKDPGEAWVRSKLWAIDWAWTRKAIWGCRLFDFWYPTLGIAVQVDKEGQDDEAEAYADEYNYRRSSILVLRVEPFNEDDMNRALEALKIAELWKERRARLGNLIGDAHPPAAKKTKKAKKPKKKPFPACFVAFNEGTIAPRRYTRRRSDWLVEVWQAGEWKFHDSVGYETAQDAFARGDIFFPSSR